MHNRHDICNMHGRPPHTNFNINDSQIIFDFYNLPQKMPWYNIYLSFDNHHTRETYIPDTQHAHKKNRYTTNRRFLGIFAYTPGVICSNKYHTSHTYISFSQHAHEFLIHVIGKKTFVRCTSSLFGTHDVDNRHK